ncbi:MAG TPA: DUF58 domain-containing protein [Polyangiales bacterium]
MIGEPTREHARSALGSRLFLALGLLALGLVWVPWPLRTPVLIAGNALIALLYTYDRARLLRSQLALRRTLTTRMRPRSASPYTLELTLVEGPPLRLLVEERPPPALSLAQLRHVLRLRRDHTARLAGEVTLVHHGRLLWPELWLRRESALGLCALITQHALPTELTAYPALPSASQQLDALAPQRPGRVPAALRVVEQGGEIERLREYVSTDSMRNLDWKATAKRRRPITRTFQPERNQTLWIVLDTSRVMTLPAEVRDEPRPAGTRFEAALEAALALADAALAEGDRVGLLPYGRDAAEGWVMPQAGHAQRLMLLRRSLSLRAHPTEFDAPGLLVTLARCAPKRSLVVLFTDLDNEGDLRELARHAPLLSRRHASLCVSLRPEQLRARREAPIERERDVYRKLAAISLHDRRTQLSRDLESAGLSVVESAPSQLARSIVQRYRMAKISGRV